VAEVAKRLKLDAALIEAWMDGTSQPTQAQLRKVAEIVRRPTALFYRPEPPQLARAKTNLRGAPGAPARSLTPEEVRSVRWLTRLQEAMAWILQQEAESPTEVPFSTTASSSEEAAAALRSWLGVRVEEQIGWSDDRVALDEWRSALEDRKIIVTQFQIDRTSIRGFSAWNELVPMVAINTAYTPKARIFTLFHEVGHLLNRDQSACFGFVDPSAGGGIERWCERFAADFLLPEAEVRRQAASTFRWHPRDPATTFAGVRTLSNRFKVSVRATAIRLSDLALAPKGLYSLVESELADRFEDFPRPGGGGGGQTAAEKRLSHLGERTLRILISAADQRSITERDLADYLHVTSSQLDDVRSLVNRGRQH
jgi:Zn-dependent peptidase ImmA (M78 family)